MIIVKQRLRVTNKHDDTVFVPAGQYTKLPKELKEDKDFLYFVHAGTIEGYELTKADKEKFAKMPKLASIAEKRKAKVLVPDGVIPKKVEKPEGTSKKNKI